MGLITSKDKTPTQFEMFMKELPDLRGKVIAITGCTSGLGYVFAQTCVKKDAAAVILLNRPSDRAKDTEKSLKEIANADTTVETIDCDLQDFASVRRAAAQLKEKHEALDVLCNNAGVMALPDEATGDGYDVQVQTNYLSHFLLTKDLFPLLQKAKELRGESRIVNQSSYMRFIPYTNLKKEFLQKKGGDLGGSGYLASWGRYHQSKLALTVFACALRERLKGTGIKVTISAPGYSSTKLQSTTPGMAGLRWSRIVAQSAEDGCMPMLSAAFRPCSDTTDKAMIWEPGRFRLYGPAVELELEEVPTKKEFHDILWEASEQACGKFDP